MAFDFLTSSGVFSPKRIDKGTRLLVENVIIPDSGRLLDLGCGYGVVGIAIAKSNPNLEVWMTDINERAVILTKKNLKLNEVKNALVKFGDLYETVEGIGFNVVVSNPPISAGMRRIVKPMVEGAHKALESQGSLQMVVQSNKGGRALADMMESCFGGIEIIARGGGYRVLAAFKN